MIQQNPYQQRKPMAFISCSLRQEDKPFVDRVEWLVKVFGFQPVGTVGKYDAAPQPIWQRMKDSVRSADCVVLAATPRYLQQDISDKKRTGKAMSEMLHTEVGMAVASDRPVLAFVLEGTEVGNFLPQAVQYITLKQDGGDIFLKWRLINSYFSNARSMIQERWVREDRSQLFKFVVGGLAVLGGKALWDRFNENGDDDYEDAEDYEPEDEA
jgi:hypothetical protein